ncbi:MAG: hypothetical protein VKJ64_18820 [Leptolyngbyaceae bacterium]|nr:hypothetical protein [Leptolyngbyaceae bacterium]
MTLISCSRSSVEKRIQNISICEYNDYHECDRSPSPLSPTAPYLMATAEIQAVPVNRDILVEWNYLGAEANPPQAIATLTYPKTTSDIISMFTVLSQPDNGWPVGAYEIVLSVDDNADRMIRQSFEISPIE